MNMYIKLEKNRIVFWSAIFLVLMDSNFIYLIKTTGFLSKIWSSYVKFLILLLAFFIWLFYCAGKKVNIFLKKYTILCTISFISVSILSSFVYPEEKIAGHLLAYGGIILVILSIPLVNNFVDFKSEERFLKAINLFSFAVYVIFIFQAILYTAGGPFFLKTYHNMRNGMVRIGMPCIANIMFIYNYCKCVYSKENRKAFYFLQIVLGAICIFLIQQTRAYEVAIIVSLFAIYVLKSNNMEKIIRNLFIASILIVVISRFPFVKSFISSFTEGSQVDNTLIRVSGYAYFFDAFIKNPIMGHGFLTKASYESIRVGPYGYFFYADTGFVGLMAQMGIFSFGVYLWPIIHWAKQLIESKEKSDPFLLGLFIFVIVTSPSLIMTNPERVMGWTLVFALFAYEEEKVQNDL